LLAFCNHFTSTAFGIAVLLAVAMSYTPVEEDAMTLREALDAGGDQLENRKGTERLEVSVRNAAQHKEFAAALRHINTSTSDQLHHFDSVGRDLTIEQVNSYAAEQGFDPERWDVRHRRPSA
jgi:hypothetical protein